MAKDLQKEYVDVTGGERSVYWRVKFDGKDILIPDELVRRIAYLINRELKMDKENHARNTIRRQDTC